MKEKLKLNEVIINEIFNEYNNGISMRKISEIHKLSFSYIQKLITSKNNENQILLNYPQIDNKIMIAICKKTGKSFDDYLNRSGALTSHIKTIFPSIIIPSNYKLKSLEYKTGKFWYDEYFTFQYREIKPIFHCKLCDWTTEDINNESGAYEKHLKNIHGLKLDEYLRQFPNDREYFKKEIYDELVTCGICGEKMKIINSKHLSTHNITPTEYKLQFKTEMISPQSREKLINTYNEVLRHQGFIKSSKLEQFIVDNVNTNFIRSNRKLLNGKEIDLIHEETKSCFEINGCLFHSEIFGKKNREYHKTKTTNCANLGYNLYHIFEDEIMYKPQILISKIENILNISQLTPIHARKCEIFELTDTIKKSTFLNDNHIQGNSISNVTIAAKYNNEIVAIMCFDNERLMNKSNTHNNTIYELTRFCVKLDKRVTGIANRLLKYFISNYKPSKIISFADIRWTPNSENNLYVKLGFTLKQTLKPDYTYYNPKIDRYKRFHKFGFGKTNLKRKFPEIYDDSKTEWEMMQELGYDRIWDCGKYKYELELT